MSNVETQFQIPTSWRKVQVWIVCQDINGESLRFLLLRTNPKRGGFWQPVTGSVEPDEAFAAGALREAREETGLSFEGPARSLNHSFTFEARGGTVEEHGFFLVVAPGEDGNPPAVKMDPHEHDQFQWVASAEAAIRQLKFPSNADMLQRLVRELSSTKKGNENNA